MTSDDPRLCDIVKDGIRKDITLLGFPYDEGVKRNGGRPGAAIGPEMFRKLLFERRTGTAINAEVNIDITHLEIGNAGLIDPELTLEAAHSALQIKVAEILNAGSVPFVIGGGNDQSYANASGLLSYLETVGKQASIGVINIDAHLDVRPKNAQNQIHSGTPFRLLLEDPRFMAHYKLAQNSARCFFVEFACQGDQCSAAHVKYVKDRQGSLFWMGNLRRAVESGNPVQVDGSLSLSSVSDSQRINRGSSSAATTATSKVVLNTTPVETSIGRIFSQTLDAMSGDHLFVSFDLDAVRSADAPGVSCPSPKGLTADEALSICFEAGRHSRVSLFDISELNPKIEDYRTARLVVFMFYYFALGFSLRNSR